jgi:hypothetical protein
MQVPLSVVGGRLRTVTMTSLCRRGLSCADFMTNSDIRHLRDAGAPKERNIAAVGNSARTGCTGYALTTDARQDTRAICS